MARQQLTGPPGPVDRLGNRLAALVPAAQMLGRAVIGLQSGKGEVRCLGNMPNEVECRLALSAATNRLGLGDKIRLIPGHCDPTVNLYDLYVCVRGNRVEQIWPITARGAVY